MNLKLDEAEFCFDDDKLAALEPKPMTAADFLRMAEGQNEEGLDELMAALEAVDINFDISDLPRLGATGQAALRLREEMDLSKQADMTANLDAGDALRIYLEELAAQKGSSDLERDIAELAAANAADDDSIGFTTPLLIDGMRFVVEVAKDYVGYGVLLLDLIQEGNIGLCQRLAAYVGGSFKPIVEEGIRQAMIRAILRQTVASGLGRKIRQAVEDYRTADERLLTDLGRNPTPEEMAEYLHMSVEEVENVRKTLENARMVDKAHIQPETEEEDPEDAQAVEDTAYYQTRETVNDLMSALTPVETELLNLRYGLNGKAPLTIQETALRLNMTTAEVTETEQIALAKMRGNQ